MNEIEKLLKDCVLANFGYHPDEEYTQKQFKAELKHLIELVENEQAEICQEMVDDCERIHYVDCAPRVSEQIAWEEL